jgi:hypothetical protein
MKRFSAVCLLLLLTSSAFAETKPKFGPRTRPIALENQYLRKRNKAPDYWAMTGFKIAQADKQCGTATLAMVVNAARAALPLSSDAINAFPTAGANANEEDPKGIIERVTNPVYKEAISKGECIDLSTLADVAVEVFRSYGFRNVIVSKRHTDINSSATLQHFRALLAGNEQSAQDFVIVNFQQGYATGDTACLEDCGHFSPIGAYDMKSDRVLIMDVDSKWYPPYWAPASELFRGMVTRDHAADHYRGYLHIIPGEYSGDDLHR